MIVLISSQLPVSISAPVCRVAMETDSYHCGTLILKKTLKRGDSEEVLQPLCSVVSMWIYSKTDIRDNDLLGK